MGGRAYANTTLRCRGGRRAGSSGSKSGSNGCLVVPLLPIVLRRESAFPPLCYPRENSRTLKRLTSAHYSSSQRGYQVRSTGRASHSPPLFVLPGCTSDRTWSLMIFKSVELLENWYRLLNSASISRCVVEYSSNLERTRDRINRNITDKEEATLVHKLRNCLFSVIAHGDLELLLAVYILTTTTTIDNSGTPQRRGRTWDDRARDRISRAGVKRCSHPQCPRDMGQTTVLSVNLTVRTRICSINLHSHTPCLYSSS